MEKEITKALVALANYRNKSIPLNSPVYDAISVIINGYNVQAEEKFAFIKKIVDIDEDDFILLDLFYKALLDLKSGNPKEYRFFNSNTRNLEDMEMYIKTGNVAYIKDNNHVFETIEIRDDGLYVETKNGYFYLDNDGNKIREGKEG